jgi:hypothetical protein
MDKTFKVTFTGFETEEQAKTFADWFEGQGEQDASIWMEENSDITDVCVNMESFTNTPNSNNEIIVLLDLYK